MTKEAASNKSAAGPREKGSPRRLYIAVAIAVAAGALLWGIGRLLLHNAEADPSTWNAVWLVSGISFVGATVLPTPGTTLAVLLSLRLDPLAGTLAVLGAAIGGTLAAGLLLALGDTGRAVLRKRATKSKRSRRFLEWSKKLEHRWTYVGVALLLIPWFIPRSPVLYAAVLGDLRRIPFLIVVFVGTFLRNATEYVALALGWAWFQGAAGLA